MKLAEGERNVAGEVCSSYGSSFVEISMCVAPVVAPFPGFPDQKRPVRPKRLMLAPICVKRLEKFQISRLVSFSFIRPLVN